MVIAVFADIVQIYEDVHLVSCCYNRVRHFLVARTIVFAASSDTLLTVHGSLELSKV